MESKIVVSHGSYKCRWGESGYRRPRGSILTGRYGAIRNSVIIDESKMIEIWDEIISEGKIEPTRTSILLTETVGNGERNRRQVKEVMFELYNFKRMQIANEQVLSLYGTGMTSGVITDIGHDLARCVPIYDSYMIESGVRRSKLGGRTLNEYIRAEDRIESTDEELDKRKKKREYNKENEKIFIEPERYGCEEMSIPDMIVESLNDVDIDVKRGLANIVLVGGTTKITGLCKTIMKEVRERESVIEVKMTAKREREISSWIGGSILSGLPTFEKNWITQKEYYELI